MSAAAAWPCPALGAAGSGADALAVPLHTLSVPLSLSFPLGALYLMEESHSPS